MLDLRLGRWAVVCPALVLIALACGDDSDADSVGSCSTFVACGGDPVGTWRASEVCVPADIASQIGAQLPPECDGAILLDNATSNTTLTIGADGVITEQGSINVSWAMTFDEACISATAGGLDVNETTARVFCDALQASLEGQADPAAGGFTQVMCAVEGTNCSCTARQDQDLDNSGTLSVEGNSLVYGGGGRQDFCVNADQLDLGPPEGSPLQQAYSIYERVSP